MTRFGFVLLSSLLLAITGCGEVPSESSPDVEAPRRDISADVGPDAAREADVHVDAAPLAALEAPEAMPLLDAPGPESELASVAGTDVWRPMLPLHIDIRQYATDALVGTPNVGEFGHQLGHNIEPLMINIVDPETGEIHLAPGIVVRSHIDVRTYVGSDNLDVFEGVFHGLTVEHRPDEPSQVLLHNTDDPSWPDRTRGSIEILDANLGHVATLLQDLHAVIGTPISATVLEDGRLAIASPLTNFGSYAGILMLVPMNDFVGDVSLSSLDTEILSGSDGNMWGQIESASWDRSFVVGMPGDTTLGGLGLIYIVPRTARSGILNGVSSSWFGIDSDDRLGQIITNIGDIDGDGHTDLAVGVPTYDSYGDEVDVGEVFVLYGGTTYPRLATLESVGIPLHPRVPGGLYGSQVHALGDIDQDGYDDVAVRAGGEQALYVCFGWETSKDEPVTHPFEYCVRIQGHSDKFGISTAMVDGALYIGAPLVEERTGAVYIIDFNRWAIP